MYKFGTAHQPPMSQLNLDFRAELEETAFTAASHIHIVRTHEGVTPALPPEAALDDETHVTSKALSLADYAARLTGELARAPKQVIEAGKANHIASHFGWACETSGADEQRVRILRRVIADPTEPLSIKEDSLMARRRQIVQMGAFRGQRISLGMIVREVRAIDLIYMVGLEQRLTDFLPVHSGARRGRPPKSEQPIPVAETGELVIPQFNTTKDKFISDEDILTERENVVLSMLIRFGTAKTVAEKMGARHITYISNTTKRMRRVLGLEDIPDLILAGIALDPSVLDTIPNGLTKGLSEPMKEHGAKYYSPDPDVRKTYRDSASKDLHDSRWSNLYGPNGLSVEGGRSRAVLHLVKGEILELPDVAEIRRKLLEDRFPDLAA